MDKSKVLRILQKLDEEGYFLHNKKQKEKIDPLRERLEMAFLSAEEEQKIIDEILDELPSDVVANALRRVEQEDDEDRGIPDFMEAPAFEEEPEDRAVGEELESQFEEEAESMFEEEPMESGAEEKRKQMVEEEPMESMAGSEPESMGEEEVDSMVSDDLDEDSLPAGAVQKDGYVEVSVYYGTDRKRKDLDRARDRTHPEIPVKFEYKGERSSNPRKLEFGVARVSIPEGHERGRIEKPRFKIFKKKPEKHVTLTHPLEFLIEADFIGRLKETLKKATEKQALVFIHGYNVKFEAALERTAQLAYDLEYAGVPLLYSWPSNGRTTSYTGDEGNVSGAYHLLHEFLKIILADVEAEEVHIIAHSMGNRALTECLSRIRLSEVLKTPNRISSAQVNRIKRVVFAAPDVDQDRFKYLAESFPHETTRYTLYASTKDFALESSQKLHSGNPRAGDSDVLCIAPNVESIDVSRLPQDPNTKHKDLLGHGYYATSKTILADVHRLFTHSGFMTAEERGHVPHAEGGWLFNHEQITIDENIV